MFEADIHPTLADSDGQRLNWLITTRWSRLGHCRNTMRAVSAS